MVQCPLIMEYPTGLETMCYVLNAVRRFLEIQEGVKGDNVFRALLL